MTFLILFYFLPMLIVWVLAILMPTYDKTATKGNILAGLGIALIPLSNIVVSFLIIGELFKTDPIQKWLKTTVRKDMREPAAKETPKVDEVA